MALARTSADENVDDGLQVDASSCSSATITDSLFSDSTVGYGVLINPAGDSAVSLERVAVTGNSYGGVLIDDLGYDGVNDEVTILDSTIADNDGTGIDIWSAASSDVFVRGTTISGNSQEENGAIWADLVNDSSLSILNSTISSNRQLFAGAIAASTDATGTITISHSTITDKVTRTTGEPGGLRLEAVNYSIDHSIIAGNTADGAPSDLLFDPTMPPTGSISYSLIQASTGSALTVVDAGTGNLKNKSARLGALADNGGRTLTHLPLDGSPVINAGNPAITCAPATDQRGQTRIAGIIDLGSVEVKQAQPAATGSNPTFALTGGTVLLLVGVVILILVWYRHKR